MQLTASALSANAFILTAFDHDQWCPVLETRFHVDDLEPLRSILGERACNDPELLYEYSLDHDEWSAVSTKFAAAFDPTRLLFNTPEVFLSRQHQISRAPYLIHTGYELPLLLDGRKKLARMSHEYPPDDFEGEDRFDHWVSEGVLSKTVISEPFDRPIRNWSGHRPVYYTPVGEEWRVPAMQLVFEASGKSAGWNEYFERLEGMLFRYSEAENDWWINVGLQGGGFGGAGICCAVDHDGLAWIEAAGFRALPPSTNPIVKMCAYWTDSENELRDLLFEDSGAVALVRFNVLGRHIMKIVDLRTAGPWEVPSHQIPIINQHLRGSVLVFARREPPADTGQPGV